MQELDIAMSHVRTIHRVAGMTGREKMHFHLQEVEVEESEPDRNISDSDSDW